MLTAAAAATALIIVTIAGAEKIRMETGRRSVTLFTGQWKLSLMKKICRRHGKNITGKKPLEVMCIALKIMGFDGVEFDCWNPYFDIKLANDPERGEAYLGWVRSTLEKYDIKCMAISHHLAGQLALDEVDNRHSQFCSAGALLDMIQDQAKKGEVKKNGEPTAKMKKLCTMWENHEINDEVRALVRRWATYTLIQAGRAAKALGVGVVNGFIGSPIWACLYPFPQMLKGQEDKAYDLAIEVLGPVMLEFAKLGIRFGLEVHPTELAFDIVSTRKLFARIEKAVSDKEWTRAQADAFGLNYDPSHLVYAGVDYVKFILEFGNKIVHVHMKDAEGKKELGDASVFNGFIPFGDPMRQWDFRSIGHGDVNFRKVIRALNHIGYEGFLSIEWEDNAVDPEDGATESCRLVKSYDFRSSDEKFDATMHEEEEDEGDDDVNDEFLHEFLTACADAGNTDAQEALKSFPKATGKAPAAAKAATEE